MDEVLFLLVPGKRGSETYDVLRVDICKLAPGQVPICLVDTRGLTIGVLILVYVTQNKETYLKKAAILFCPTAFSTKYRSIKIGRK